jgi:hypothetical protein
MLDGIGLQEALGLSTSTELFSSRRDLLHTTSIIRYPVFVDGKNYTGSSPDLTRSPFLLAFTREILVPELRSVPEALIVPCGTAVEAVLTMLTAEGVLSADRWLSGFPHPSGANGHRVRLFEQNRRQLRRQVKRILQFP